MKQLTILLFIIILIGCTSTTEPEIEYDPSMKITITDLKQTYYTSFHSWSMVEVFYEVENVGDCDLQSYGIKFKVNCTNAVYYDDTFDLFLDVTEKSSHSLLIDTAGKKYINVSVMSSNIAK
jgi:PBP1b-binding outer membrane lipoprotein LpoB